MSIFSFFKSYNNPPPRPRIVEPVERRDINSQDPGNGGFTPLVSALLRRDMPNTHSLVRDPRILVNKPSHSIPVDNGSGVLVDDVYFPALFAIGRFFDDGLKELLTRNGFDANAQTQVVGISAIYYALYKDNFSAVNILLTAMETQGLKLNINIQTSFGLTPLHVAILKGVQDEFVAIVKRILTYPETDIFLATNAHRSAVMLANNEPILKDIFTTYIEENFLIRLQEAPNNAVERFNEQEIEIPNLDGIDGFEMLTQLQVKRPSIKFIQLNKAGILYHDDGLKKICLVRFAQDKIILELCDYDFFVEYLIDNHTCPITRKPLANYMDFSNPGFDRKCYVLSNKIFQAIEDRLQID